MPLSQAFVLWCLISVPLNRKNLVLASLALPVAFIVSFVVVPPRSTVTLHASLVVSKVDVGIPGISKLYEAKITNKGPWPVVVTRCNAIDDAGGKETILAYAIQRWNSATSHWDNIVAWDKSSFCKPYPLGIVEADLRNAPLWPGQSLSTGGEATAARLRKGDAARFVVLTGEAGDSSHSIATESFLIDEEVLHPDVPFRVRH